MGKAGTQRARHSSAAAVPVHCCKPLCERAVNAVPAHGGQRRVVGCRSGLLPKRCPARGHALKEHRLWGMLRGRLRRLLGLLHTSWRCIGRLQVCCLPALLLWLMLLLLLLHRRCYRLLLCLL